MGIAEIEKALELVKRSDRARFIGPRDPSLVEAAEAALSLTLPPTYRRFVTELGAGSVGPRELYGVTAKDFRKGSVPNGIWLTLEERKRFKLPESLVIVGDTGMGEYFVLDTGRTGPDDECPVALWVRGEPAQKGGLKDYASDFGAFFLEGIREALGLI